MYLDMMHWLVPQKTKYKIKKKVPASFRFVNAIGNSRSTVMVFFLKTMLSSQRIYWNSCQRAPDSVNMLPFFLSTHLSSMKRPKSCLFKCWIVKMLNTYVWVQACIPNIFLSFKAIDAVMSSSGRNICFYILVLVCYLTVQMTRT